MPYSSTALNHNSTYTLQATTVTGTCSCSVVTMKTSGSMSVEILVSPNVSGKQVPNGAARMTFIVNAPVGTSGVFKVIQGANTLADLIIGGSAPVDLVFTVDVA